VLNTSSTTLLYDDDVWWGLGSIVHTQREHPGMLLLLTLLRESFDFFLLELLWVKNTQLLAHELGLLLLHLFGSVISD